MTFSTRPGRQPCLGRGRSSAKRPKSSFRDWPIGWAFHWRRTAMSDATDSVSSNGHGDLDASSFTLSPAYYAARRRDLSIDDYYTGVRNGDFAVLARALTLIESSSPRHRALADELIGRLLPYTGQSVRVGIT